MAAGTSRNETILEQLKWRYTEKKYDAAKKFGKRIGRFSQNRCHLPRRVMEFSLIDLS